MIVALALAAAALTQVRDSYPHLSPDGRTLIFHSNRSGRQAIWSAAGDGSSPRLLFDEPALGSDPGTPVWSPDGKWIAFAMRPDGSGLRAATSGSISRVQPSVTADGKRLLYENVETAGFELGHIASFEVSLPD